MDLQEVERAAAACSGVAAAAARAWSTPTGATLAGAAPGGTHSTHCECCECCSTRRTHVTPDGYVLHSGHRWTGEAVCMSTSSDRAGSLRPSGAGAAAACAQGCASLCTWNLWSRSWGLARPMHCGGAWRRHAARRCRRRQRPRRWCCSRTACRALPLARSRGSSCRSRTGSPPRVRPPLMFEELSASSSIHLLVSLFSVPYLKFYISDFLSSISYIFNL